MTNPEWKKFTGSDEQIDDMSESENGYIIKWSNGIESKILIDGDHDHIYDYGNPTHCWIIPADPLREMKIRQAMTGQPVWVKVTAKFGRYGYAYSYHQPTTTPDWYLYAEYSFTPFEEEYE